MSDGSTGTDQKRHGSHKEHYAKLIDSFKELEALAAADGARFKTLVFTLLKAYETMRIEQEATIARLERQIEYCRAKQKSCSEFSDLLVGMVAVQVQEAKTAIPPAPAPSIDRAPSDKEVLKTICICGCQDDEDAANCDCRCHTEGYCDDERCAVCAAKKLALEQETSKRRKPPAPTKKKSKKKAKKKAKK